MTWDFSRTSALYASAGIPEYWIVNLIDRQLEVFRNPAASTSASNEFEYRDQRILKSGESIGPLSMPQSLVAIAEMLP